MVDDDVEVDRRYPPVELDTGWHFRSPIDRWETVSRVEIEGSAQYPVAVRVWTDQTGPDYAWRLSYRDRVHAVPPTAEYVAQQPEIRLVDLPRDSFSGGRYIAVLTFRAVAVPDFIYTLVRAEHVAAGGWAVCDRPAGGDEVVTRHPTKAHARTAVRRAARVHAKALGIPVREEEQP